MRVQHQAKITLFPVTNLCDNVKPVSVVRHRSASPLHSSVISPAPPGLELDLTEPNDTYSITCLYLPRFHSYHTTGAAPMPEDVIVKGVNRSNSHVHFCTDVPPFRILNIIYRISSNRSQVSYEPGVSIRGNMVFASKYIIC